MPGRRNYIGYTSLVRASIVKLYEEQIGATSGELVIVGDFDPDATIKHFESMLAGWKSDRARSLHGIVAGVEGDLRGGLDGKRAGAIIRALTSAEIYSELVAGEGWSPDEYEEWLGGLLKQHACELPMFDQFVVLEQTLTLRLLQDDPHLLPRDARGA